MDGSADGWLGVDAGAMAPPPSLGRRTLLSATITHSAFLYITHRRCAEAKEHAHCKSRKTDPVYRALNLPFEQRQQVVTSAACGKGDKSASAVIVNAGVLSELTVVQHASTSTGRRRSTGAARGRQSTGAASSRKRARGGEAEDEDGEAEGVGETPASAASRADDGDDVDGAAADSAAASPPAAAPPASGGGPRRILQKKRRRRDSLDDSDDSSADGSE